MSNMKKYFLAILGTYLFAFSCSAAELSFSMPTQSQVGSRVVVDILLDPQGDSINSVGVTFSFPHELLTFRGYDSAQGTIPMWVESPKELPTGDIHFSGIIPGGLERLYDPENPSQNSIRLTRLIFEGQNSGTGKMAFKEALLLKNDGLGTTVSSEVSQHTFIILPSSDETQKENNTSSDLLPPDPFSISILEKSSFGMAPRLAIFEAKDKESGIEHYEAQINAHQFKKVVSPLPLPARFFTYTLNVRAFDFYGNYREQSIRIPGLYTKTSLGVVVLVITMLLLYNYSKKKKNYENQTSIT